MATSKYADLGVDAGKGNVRSTFGPLIDNEFPGAFVNIITDPTDAGTAVTQHGDGDGSKGIQRILAFLETRNPIWLPGMVDDAVSMNMGDIAASGFLSGLITWTDNLNISSVPSADLKQTIMQAMAERFRELRALYQDHGFIIKFLGGETADLPDQVASSVFDVTVCAREPIQNVIKGNVRPGDIIYGFHSDGQAAWEKEPNSGIMSNGLTLAATCLVWDEYSKEYPGLRLKNSFTGRYTIGQKDDLLADMSVFEALLSPTRQWALLIKILVDKLREEEILDQLHGISMNTGGGATKIGHVGSGILYRKTTMPEPPGIFKLIQREGAVSWEEMFQDFNCGVGLDVVGENTSLFHKCVQLASHESMVAYSQLGFAEAHEGDGNKVVLETPHGTFNNY